MKEVIIGGLGGQGPKLAGDCLVKAALLEGKYAQSRPCYGPERRAGVVIVFYRLNDAPIRRKCTFIEADCVLLMHEYLLESLRSLSSVTTAKVIQNGPSLLRLDDSMLRGMLYFGATGITEVKLKKGGIIIANTKDAPENIKFKNDVQPSKIATLDAYAISREIYGDRAISIVNTVMMGAFVKVSGWLKIDSLIEAIRLQWPQAAEINAKAALKGYEAVKILEV
ncbi:MAG: 2-oxoacid:acceptor oxidoreductase family protein [Candidatus Bathyarchaeia archaeon]